MPRGAEFVGTRTKPTPPPLSRMNIPRVAVGQLLLGLDKTGTKVPPHRQAPRGASEPATRIGGEVTTSSPPWAVNRPCGRVVVCADRDAARPSLSWQGWSCRSPMARIHDQPPTLMGVSMARTVRTRYDGQKIRDGQHGHRCPEPKCDWCVSKPPFPEQEHITRSREES